MVQRTTFTLRSGWTRRGALAGGGALALGGSAVMLHYLGARRPATAPAALTPAGDRLVASPVIPGGYGRDPELMQPRRPLWSSRLRPAAQSVLPRLADVVLAPPVPHLPPSRV